MPFRFTYTYAALGIGFLRQDLSNARVSKKLLELEKQVARKIKLNG